MNGVLEMDKKYPVKIWKGTIEPYLYKETVVIAKNKEEAEKKGVAKLELKDNKDEDLFIDVVEIESLYAVVNDSGEVSGHDLDLGTAELNLEVMQEKYPEENWDIILQDR